MILSNIDTNKFIDNRKYLRNMPRCVYIHVFIHTQNICVCIYLHIHTYIRTHACVWVGGFLGIIIIIITVTLSIVIYLYINIHACMCTFRFLFGLYVCTVYMYKESTNMMTDASPLSVHVKSLTSAGWLELFTSA